jgi:hypothetical protein
MSRVTAALKGCATAALLVLVSAPGALAQPSDEMAVRAVVEQFLLHLGDHQFDAVAGDLAPKALVVVTRLRPSTLRPAQGRPEPSRATTSSGRGEPVAPREGEWVNSYQTGDEWIAALKNNPNPTTFREPISNVTVTIDSNQLAYVRADFKILRDGQMQSSGVDQFTLVREPTGWKIAVVAYTSQPAAR